MQDGAERPAHVSQPAESAGGENANLLRLQTRARQQHHAQDHARPQPRHGCPSFNLSARRRDYRLAQRLLLRSMSAKTFSGSISTAVIVAGASRYTVCRLAPASHTSTGTTWRSTRPSARAMARRTGIGANPRSSIVTASLPFVVSTDAMA